MRMNSGAGISIRKTSKALYKIDQFLLSFAPY